MQSTRSLRLKPDHQPPKVVTSFSLHKRSVETSSVADTVCPRPPLTLTFDRLTLKLVCESYLRWGTYFPNLSTLGLCVLELLAVYATDTQTDRRTDGQKQRLLPPSLRLGHNNTFRCKYSSSAALCWRVWRSIKIKCCYYYY